MLWVSSVPEAVQAVVRGERELRLQLDGDHASRHGVQLVRNRVWQQVNRRAGPPVSVSLIGKVDTGQTLFLVRTCRTPRHLSSSEQAEIYLAVTISGLTRQQAADKFSVAVSTVSDVVNRIRGTRTDAKCPG